uniref:Uncharacterized protein n=1 Tax=Picocystis salinarum TaxID=88271 RepID=A0A7S3XAR3_9CHLO
MAALGCVRTPLVRTARLRKGRCSRFGGHRKSSIHWEMRAEPSSSGSDAGRTPASGNEEEEDSLGERAEKTVLVQYKVRWIRMRGTETMERKKMGRRISFGALLTILWNLPSV